MENILKMRMGESFREMIEIYRNQLPECHGMLTLFCDKDVARWRVVCSKCGKDTGYHETMGKTKEVWYAMVGQAAILHHIRKIQAYKRLTRRK